MIRSIIVGTVLSVSLASTAGAAGVADTDVATGVKVFADQKCSLCHSIGATGNKKGPLDEVGSQLSPAEIREWITNSKEMAAKAKATRTPAMKMFALPKSDVDALVAYLQTLKKNSRPGP